MFHWEAKERTAWSRKGCSLLYWKVPSSRTLRNFKHWIISITWGRWTAQWLWISFNQKYVKKKPTNLRPSNKSVTCLPSSQTFVAPVPSHPLIRTPSSTLPLVMSSATRPWSCPPNRPFQPPATMWVTWATIRKSRRGRPSNNPSHLSSQPIQTLTSRPLSRGSRKWSKSLSSCYLQRRMTEVP